MPKLLVITHPEVTVDPAIPVTDWSLSALGRQRAHVFSASRAFAAVTQIWTSAERKALETSDILASVRALPVSIESRLGENDRSATGFLPPQEFEAAADAFFSHPDARFRGWETAVDAQIRIRQAVSEIAQTHTEGDLAVVTHGAVGTLLWCALSGHPINRLYDQPSQGHFWQAELPALAVSTGWLPIA